MEARLTIEGQMLGLTSSEFRKELTVAERNFQKEILKRVHLLKLRDTQICRQIIEEDDLKTQIRTDELKNQLEELKADRDRNLAVVIENFQKVERHSHLWYRKRIMQRYFQHFKDNWLAKKEAKTFIPTMVEKFQYNFVTIDQLKQRVDEQVETELVHKQNKVLYLENLILEMEDQYKISLQKRALVKNV